MGVVIKGINKLDANWFKAINISEDKNTGEYQVYVFNEDFLQGGNRIGISFSEQIKDMAAEEKIISIINMYLKDTKINAITAPISSGHRSGKWVNVYGNNGTKILRLQLFNSNFAEIFRKIQTKYFNDRYEFFWRDDVKKIKLSLDSKKSAYNVYPIECEDCKRDIICSEDKDAIPTCETYVDYSIKVDKEMGIILAEKLFLTELLNYKFSQIGEEVQVKDITIGREDSLNTRFHSHIIRCGDFELTFPHKEIFMFIFGIVNDYNRELYEAKMNEKKRQLKMEEF